MHRSRPSLICIDVPAAQRDDAANFWSKAFARPVRLGTSYPEYSVLGDVAGWGVLIQAVGEEHARVHFDIHTDDVNAEVARLEALGATVVNREHRWVVLSDPSGLIFCVVPVDSDDPSLLGANEWD